MSPDEANAIGQTCLALHMRRASRRMARLYDDALRPVALNNGQFSVMTMLAGRNDWTMQTLADALGLDQSSLTASVKPLRRRGLVEAVADARDGRVRRLRLSAAGDATIADAVALWRRAQAAAEALIGVDAGSFRQRLRALG